MVIKLLALALFVAVALPVFNAAHFQPFMPFGFAKSGPPGSEVGVMAAAAIIFFAFYGFDAIATAAEEAKNPSRDLAIGIVGSMVAVRRSSTWRSPPPRSARSPTPASPTAPSRWR